MRCIEICEINPVLFEIRDWFLEIVNTQELALNTALEICFLIALDLDELEQKGVRDGSLSVFQYDLTQFLLIEKRTHPILFQFNDVPFFHFFYLFFSFVIPLIKCLFIHRDAPLHAAGHGTLG